MRAIKGTPLKYRMILGGIAAVVIPFSITGMVIYFQLSHSLLEMTKEKSVLLAQDISSVIEATLDHKIDLASSIAADPDIIEASRTGDYRIAQEELESIHRRIGDKLFTLFLTDRYGIDRADAVFAQQIGLDLSDRDYFRNAKEGRTSVSGPLFPRGTATPGVPIVVVCAPIREGNTFYGTVTIAIDTDFLMNIILRKRLGRTGYAYLINSEGLMLIHPRKEYILRLNLLDQPGTTELEKVVRSGNPGAAFYSFEGSDKVAGLAGVAHTGWTVVFSQNRDEVMSPVDRLLSAVLISAAVFLIITIAIITVVSSRISSPIQKTLEMMKQVTRHSTEMILQIGPDRKIVFANQAAGEITGIPPDAMIGTEPDLGNPRDIPPHVIWNSLEAGIPWSGRVTLKGNKPDPVSLDVMLVPVRDDRGTIRGYLEIGRDISAEVMYERRLQQSQKLEAIGTLAGGIAHDFNNILSGIFGYAELSLMDCERGSAVESYIKEIRRAAERARDLVKQILTFSRQADFELKPLLPGPVVKEALKLLRASIPVTITIQSRIESSSAIMAEPTQIHQIVMNLFTNAVHAMGENAGTISLELEDFLVDEEFTRTHPDIRQGRHVMLRISDTGCGMEPEVLDHIFDPFFTTKTTGKGTGLGLSVVHGIVKRLNGIITAYSEVGKGTVFNVIIPCTEPEVPALDEGERSIEGGTERIAIIDDEKAITATMHSILTNLGYKVTAFTDGMEALEAITSREQVFDVVVTDHSMPRITGLEIAKRIKGMGIPVILTSGYFGENMEKEARDAGIAELITKPINTYQLTDAIRRVLKK